MPMDRPATDHGPGGRADRQRLGQQSIAGAFLHHQHAIEAGERRLEGIAGNHRQHDAVCLDAQLLWLGMGDQPPFIGIEPDIRDGIAAQAGGVEGQA